MSSKAAKRRARRRKAAVISLPGQEPVQQRPAGRDRTHTNQPSEDPRKQALDARCRYAGVTANRDGRRAVSDPLCGHDVGLCIRNIIKGRDAQARLWDCWQAMTAVRRLWRMRYLGVTGDPQGSAIAMLPDVLQTDQGLTVDLRTPADRDRAAKRAEAYWYGRVESIPSLTDRMALRSAIDGFGPALWRDQSPTRFGAQVVRALQSLVDTE